MRERIFIGDLFKVHSNKIYEVVEGKLRCINRNLPSIVPYGLEPIISSVPVMIKVVSRDKIRSGSIDCSVYMLNKNRHLYIYPKYIHLFKQGIDALQNIGALEFYKKVGV